MKYTTYPIWFGTSGISSLTQLIDDTALAAVSTFEDYTGYRGFVEPLQRDEIQQTEFDEEELRRLYSEFDGEDRELARQGIEKYRGLLELEDN